MSFRPVMNRTSKQNIVDLINHDNTTNYAVSDFTFGLPVVVLNNPFGNTELTVTGLPNQGVTGVVTPLYTRLDIGQYMPGDLSMAGSALTETTLAAALSEINSALGTAIQPYEVVDQAIDGSTAQSITVTMGPLSEVWAPGTTFTFAVTGNGGSIDGTLFVTSTGAFLDVGGGTLLSIATLAP